MISMSSDYSQWCHLQCAQFLTENVSIEKVTLDKKETSTVVWLKEEKDNKICTVCLGYEGITVPCSDDGCTKAYHVTCA